MNLFKNMFKKFIIQFLLLFCLKINKKFSNTPFNSYFIWYIYTAEFLTFWTPASFHIFVNRK